MTLPININRLVGENVRFFREERDISQEILATRAGIKRTSTISDIETGKSNPTVETIEKLAIALEIRPAELFDYAFFRDDQLFSQKEALIKVHGESLLKRKLEEVNYVVNSTNQLLDFIDKK